MRVHVSSPSPEFGPQIRAYAEYRLFAVLARYNGVRGARVLLQAETAGGVRCSVTIDFEGAPSVRARVTGQHAAGTIDRAAELAVQLVRRRFQPESLAATS
jgi:ribosome-associated translation inhibitor RaiA